MGHAVLNENLPFRNSGKTRQGLSSLWRNCHMIVNSLLPAEQRVHQRLPWDAQVFGYIAEYSTQRANPQRTVTRDRDVMLALLRRD
jgi:hypothetical protein